MSDLAGIITACVGLLAPTSAGLGFIWRKIEKRLDACSANESRMEAIVHRLQFEVRRNSMAVNMLSADLMRVDPKSPTLANVAAVLRTKYQPDLAIPEDWADLLARLDHIGQPGIVA